MKNRKYSEENDSLEVYKERYATFRHLDKLRWQMLQIAVAAGSAILAFGTNNATQPGWWALIAVGVLLMILGFAKIRIGDGIRCNNKVLNKFGKDIGDQEIPVTQSRWKSFSFWIAVGMVIVGIACSYLGIRS